MSSAEKDMIWRSKPWIGPAAVGRSIAIAVVGFLAILVLSMLGFLRLRPIFDVPLYVWVLGLFAVVWLASMVSLVVMRASCTYILRQNSIEVDRGIVSRNSLVVSPSAFSELEVNQGVVGRMLNYGSLEVRSQGGQQLNLRFIRDPKGVSAKVRMTMTVPTVRVAREEPPSSAPTA